MATKVVTLLELLASRGFITRSSVATNSRATLSLWNSALETEQEDDENQDNQEEEVPATISYVSTPEMAMARHEFSREYWRSMVQNVQESVAPVTGTLDQMIQRTGIQNNTAEDDYRFLAQ